ncbi:MAG TPA: MBL fold metallo-hydrolase [Gemmatimonadales bacterium]
MAYEIVIWGARGSIPTPGAETARYGGNTSCVAVSEEAVGDDRLVILDAGTGIRPLGRELTANGNGPLTLDLLVTHTHWDHIQGLPFFAPFFGEANSVRIAGPKQGAVDLERILRDQMNPVVFPVPLDQLDAQLTVTHVEPGDFEVDGFIVQSIRLRHPGVTLGYRLTPKSGGASMAYITDNELGSGGEYGEGPDWRAELVRFLEGTSVMIHDAMYTAEELDSHRGWGHSSHVESVALACEAGVDTLVLFHHRPEHDDAAMDRFVDEAREAAAKHSTALDVMAASEGLRLNL